MEILKKALKVILTIVSIMALGFTMVGIFMGGIAAVFLLLGWKLGCIVLALDIAGAFYLTWERDRSRYSSVDSVKSIRR